jgi:hypothetical protein
MSHQQHKLLVLDGQSGTQACLLRADLLKDKQGRSAMNIIGAIALITRDLAETLAMCSFQSVLASIYRRHPSSMNSIRRIKI